VNDIKVLETLEDVEKKWDIDMMELWETTGGREKTFENIFEKPRKHGIMKMKIKKLKNYNKFIVLIEDLTLPK